MELYLHLILLIILKIEYNSFQYQVKIIYFIIIIHNINFLDFKYHSYIKFLIFIIL